MTPARVQITRPDKLLWPSIGVTKQAYVDYLGAVADRMLPWLRDRPLSLVRAPDGVDGQRYFQKNTPSHAPSWIKTVTIPAPSANRDVAYTVCNDADTLAWLGNQAALEFHPAPVRRDKLDRPDLLVVDIDPPDDAFDAAVEVALLVLEILDDLGLETSSRPRAARASTSSFRSSGTWLPNGSGTPPPGSPSSPSTAGPTS